MDTVKQLYKMSYKFNAAHNTSGRENGQHVHTFRLMIYLRKLSEDYVDFYYYESRVKTLVDMYRGHCFNDFEEFAAMNPTIENICIYLFKRLDAFFSKDGALGLVQVELGDSPTQSFATGEEYLIRSANRTLTREKLLYLTERELSDARIRTQKPPEPAAVADEGPAAAGTFGDLTGTMNWDS